MMTHTKKVYTFVACWSSRVLLVVQKKKWLVTKSMCNSVLKPKVTLRRVISIQCIGILGVYHVELYF